MQGSQPNHPKLDSVFALVRETVKELHHDETQKSLDFLKHLKELDVHVARMGRKDVAALCSLAMKISEHVIRRAPIQHDELVPWAQKLVDAMSDALDGDLGAVADAESADAAKANRMVKLDTAQASGLQGKLRLVDGHRLGEILVRMSYLRAGDVERALDLQRQKGIMLGDAMVELKLLSREELDAALRVQKQKRTRGSDPWMGSEEPGAPPKFPKQSKNR